MHWEQGVPQRVQAREASEEHLPLLPVSAEVTLEARQELAELSRSTEDGEARREQEVTLLSHQEPEELLRELLEQ